jgi:hypothetical protein
MKITCHAILRYAERVLGVPPEETRDLCLKAGLDPGEDANHILALEVMGHDPKGDLMAEIASSLRARAALDMRLKDVTTIVVRKGLVVAIKLDEVITVIVPSVSSHKLKSTDRLHSTRKRLLGATA